MKQFKNFLKILVTALTFLLIGSTWWATQQGWALPRLEPRPEVSIPDCPPWQRDAFNNCPPRTHRLQLGEREFQDNRGK